MRFVATLTAVCLLVAVMHPATAEASNHDKVISLTFPVAGPSSYIDDYDQCRGQGCERRHRATDIMTEYGQPVHAAVGGRITWITGLDDQPPSYGYMITIAGDDGRSYEYIHLGRQNGPASEAYAPGMRDGVRVERGQHIGFSGCSGNASCSAPHLHFGIRDPQVQDPYGSDYLNPYASLRDAQRRGDTPDGPLNQVALTGDWDGDGQATPGWFHEGRFRLCLHRDGNCEVLEFRYGRPGDLPVSGDWNADGTDTVGVVRGRAWHLRHRHGGGAADESFIFGRAGDVPVAGDWSGDGRTTPGVRRDASWFLRTGAGGGSADIGFVYGRPADTAVVGDWSGNGVQTVGIVRGADWHLRDRHAGGGADRSFRYGRPDDLPVTGDWGGRGSDGVGIVRSGTWHLRNTASGGAGERSVDWP
jgi:hypothetical protein